MDIVSFANSFKEVITRDEHVINYSHKFSIKEREDDLDRVDGSFEYKEKKFTFMIFGGSNVCSLSLSYSVEIKFKKTKHVNIYKKINDVNSSLPGIKLFIDKISGDSIFMTCNIEVVQSKPIVDFDFIISMMDILPASYKYLQNEMNEG